MRGNTQRDWIHSVPKRTKVEATRINLTFRHVLWWVRLKENGFSLGYSLLARSWRTSCNKVPCILLGDWMYSFLDNFTWMLRGSGFSKAFGICNMHLCQSHYNCVCQVSQLPMLLSQSKLALCIMSFKWPVWCNFCLRWIPHLKDSTEQRWAASSIYYISSAGQFFLTTKGIQFSVIAASSCLPLPDHHCFHSLHQLPFILPNCLSSLHFCPTTSFFNFKLLVKFVSLLLLCFSI